MYGSGIYASFEYASTQQFLQAFPKSAGNFVIMNTYGGSIAVNLNAFSLIVQLMPTKSEVRLNQTSFIVNDLVKSFTVQYNNQ